jgi:hypothetical protein
VTACLEYLLGRSAIPSESGDGPSQGSGGDGGGDDDDGRAESDDDVDLEEAGADWLSEQGFDRRDRFSGDH